MPIEEVKEVKKTTRSKNFYFSIYQHLKQGLAPSQICNKLSISKQRLNYYLSSLKHSGFVDKIGYGVWEVKKEFEVKEVKKTTRVGDRQLEELRSDQVRGHAFQFVLKLPSGFKNWEKREEILSKKGYKFDQLILGGINRGQKMVFKNRKIWLTSNSIVIYEKSSYMADTSQKAKDYAISELLNLIKSLEKHLQANFSFGGKYKFKVSRQHYALVKNALAKQYNKEGKKLEIYNSSGLWFLVDNSFNLHEAETVHSKTAVTDNEKVQNFFNGLKEQKGYTPSFVVSSIAQNSQNLGQYAIHLKAHVQSVKDLGAGVKTQNKIMSELLHAIKDMKK